MDSFSSLDVASEFVYPPPPSFSLPVRRIQFCCSYEEEAKAVLDTDKEGLCPFKASFIVLKLPEDLLKHLGNVKVELNPKETETLSVLLNTTEIVQADKTVFRRKLFELSNPLKELVFTLDTSKAEFQLRHFDKFIKVNPDILAFIHSNTIKFIYKLDGYKTILSEEFETVRDNMIREIKDNINREDIVKLHLVPKIIDDLAAKVRIEENCVTLEGFPLDVKDADLEIQKAVKVYHTLTKTFSDDTALLLANDGVVSYCNYKLKQCESNKHLLGWDIKGDTLYIVGKNEDAVKIALQTIENCIVKHTDDFSELVFSDKADLDTFKHELLKGFQGAITFDDKNISKIVAITTAEKIEQAKFYINEFKKKFMLVTKNVKYAPWELFYLEESQKDLFGRGSLRVEQGIEQSLEVTTNLPQWSVLECTTVVRKTYGLNDTDLHGKLIYRKEQILGMSCRCKVKIQANKAQVQIKDEGIEKQQADVIVNSVPENLHIEVINPKSASYSISRAAGREALASLRENYPRGLRAGEVAKSRSGNLSCKELYHVHLEKFTKAGKDRSIQNLRRVIGTCLTYAESSGYTSLAFPAIAAGVNGYPHPIVAANMIDCIVNHVYHEFQTSLETFIITIPRSDESVKKAFIDEIERRKKEIRAAAKQRKLRLIEHPQWFCEWKVDILGETEKAVEDFVKTLNTMPV